MEELECDSVLYQQSGFVFDPEDIRTNGGFFYLLPTISNRLEVTNADGQTVLVTSASLNALLDPLFWCVLVLLAFLTLLLSTFCCQCCLACLCSAQRYEKKQFGCKVFFGILSWLLIGIIIICSAIILWSEFTMDASVELYRDNLWSFVNQTVPSESAALGVQQSMQFVFTYQLYRHWISVAMSFVTILIMLGALLAVTLCTPYKESMAPVILMLVINALWTVLVASMAAVTFFSLFLTSFVCYDLYRIGGTTRCSDQSLREESLSLQKFCSTEVYIPHLITVCAYLALVVCLIAWEIFGAFYASTFSGRRRSNKVGNTVETAGGNVPVDRDRPTNTTTPTQQPPPVTSTANDGATPLAPPTTHPQPAITPQVYPMIQLTPSLNNYLPASSRQTSAQTHQQETSYSNTPLPPEYEDCWSAP
ncbi:uncharacterized protein LOC135343268 [Halichondria panicea]|uniref:uncharacterized protein LOC135343268 n=1 Tax=Halichondria panicea TaxID=6063 RepID=UPI00312B96A5